MTDDTGSATLVDSNVLLDVLTGDQGWGQWSANRLAEAVRRGPILINQIIYGEVSHGFPTIEELDAQLTPDRFVRANVPWESAFLAALCFRAYRARGGTRTSTLPDFLIGAHAAVMGLTLLTRDATRYRTYFPTVRLVTPGKP